MHTKTFFYGFSFLYVFFLLGLKAPSQQGT